jgi:transcriptional regulator with XRE-family HTH domain
MLRARSHIGDLLREWRSVRNKSQLALALDANVSARHVSFIESGRAQPSRDMVLQLADALDVPLRERNTFLTAAGFAPMFRETGLDADGMKPVRKALESILRQQEPHPAVVMDRHWNILSTNTGAVKLFSRLIDLSAVPQPANVLRLMFDPAGLRPFVVNWEDVARSLLVRVGREAVCGAPDVALRALLDELVSYPGVPARPSLSTAATSLLPIVPVRFRKGAFEADYFSTVTTLGTPQDVTLQEIRIECFFPADEG